MSNPLANVSAQGAMALCMAHDGDIKFFLDEIGSCSDLELLDSLVDGFVSVLQRKVFSAFFAAAAACDLPAMKVFAFFAYQASLTEDGQIICAMFNGAREIVGQVDDEVRKKPGEIARMHEIFSGALAIA
jgi:hypothetical protein